MDKSIWLGQGERRGWSGAANEGDASLGQTKTTMPEHADLIVTNARILTMDEGSPRAEAIAVRGGMVVAVGSANSVASLKGPGTRMIDAGGYSVVPGFIEAHMHDRHPGGLSAG